MEQAFVFESPVFDRSTPQHLLEILGHMRAGKHFGGRNVSLAALLIDVG